MLQKQGDVVRRQTAVCEGLPLLPEVPARGAAPQRLGGMARASFASLAGPIPVTELPAETCRGGLAAKNKDALQLPSFC